MLEEDKVVNKRSTEVQKFDLYNIQIMAHLMEKNGIVDEEIVGLLDKLKWEHYSLVVKIGVLEQKINIDTKTGLFKYNEDYLEKIIKTASRVLENRGDLDYHVSYIRLDVDDFSVFNNEYGHDLGDIVLKRLADTLKNTCRPTDYCIRFGGEEFDVILPNTAVSGAKTFIEKLYRQIHGIRIAHNGTDLKITTSAGISSFHMPIDEIKSLDTGRLTSIYQDIQKEVDDSLYEAKYLGKDQFCFYAADKREEYAGMRKAYAASK